MGDMPSATGPWTRAVAAAGLLSPDGSVRPTVFARMSALASETGALNLGQGFPDTPGPTAVLDAAVAAIRSGANQYPPGRGIPDLRAAIAEHQQRCYGLLLDPDTEILVTAGATEALAATILALVSPGDEVVVIEPFYDAYAALVGLAGGVLRTIPLRWTPGADLSAHWELDRHALRAAMGPRTRLVLLNTPHNPTGVVLDADVLTDIAALAERHDAILVSDEVYEHLVFDGVHTPVAALPGATNRTLTISSGGKTFSTTGWKIGWVSGPADLIGAVLGVKQWLTYVNGSAFQPAIAAGLRLPDAEFARIAADLRDRRDLLADALRRAGLAVASPDAGYFAVADASPLGIDDGEALCERMPREIGVVAVPLTAFCRGEADAVRSLVRFAFCKHRDVIQEAALRLRRLAG